MPKLAHSFSAFEQFDNCPYAYYRQRIKKDVKFVESEESREGNRVHKAFEDRLEKKVPLPQNLAKHENICAAFEKTGGTVIAEKEYAITEDFKPTGWWSENVWLRVKNDVTILGKKVALTFDWKTGKRRPKPFQLALGALVVMQDRPEIEKVQSAFVWLRDGGAIDKESYIRQDDLDNIKIKTLEKAHRIEQALQEDVWQPKPGPLCDWCPVRHSCSFATERAKRKPL